MSGAGLSCLEKEKEGEKKKERKNTMVLILVIGVPCRTAYPAYNCDRTDERAEAC